MVQTAVQGGRHKWNHRLSGKRPRRRFALPLASSLVLAEHKSFSAIFNYYDKSEFIYVHE